MKTGTPFVKIMRCVLIGLILLVLLAVLYNYMQTRRSRNGSVKETPQILSSEMVRSVETLEYSGYREGVLHFKINARKLLESEDRKNFLEGIEAYDFNPDGSTRNEIRSQYAVYDQARNIVDFSGDVRLFLESDIELRTNSLHYNLNTNIGSTKDALRFYAHEASGTARGVRFDQKKGLLRLDGEVDFVLIQEHSLSGKQNETEKLHATSEKAHFSEMANRILFEGKAKIESPSGSLTGDRVEITLSPGQRRVTSMNAAGNADYRSQNAGQTRNLHGDRMAFDIDDSGALERIRVSNQAMFSSASPSGEFKLQGGEIILGFDPAEGSLNQLRSQTDVLFRIKNGLKQTLISGDQLRAAFNPETENVKSLHVLRYAAFSISDSAKSSGNELQANEIRMSFLDKDGRAVMEKLQAKGSAKWRFALQRNDSAQFRDRALVQEEGWTLAASQVELLYSSEGDFLESSTASGNVVISQNSKESLAGAQVRRLHTDQARFSFFPGTNQPRDMDADGHVRVIYGRKPDYARNPADESFNTASDRMRAIFELKNGEPVLKSALQSGNFVYKDAFRSAFADKCNYDAGKELLVLEGAPKISDDSGVTTGQRVEYDQKQKELSVFGRVRSILGALAAKGSFFESSSASSPIIVTAEEMRYGTEDGRTRYETKVQLLSESQQLQAQMLEILGHGDRVEAQGEILHLISDGEKSSNTLDGGKSGEPSNSEKEPIIIRSSRLQYSRGDRTLAYSGNVRLKSGDLELFSRSLDAVLDDAEKDIKSAIAHGDAEYQEEVLIRQGIKEYKGDVAYWYLDPGKFVLIGDPAEANDPERGRSSAHRLTYFTADDRILLESE
jgi:LPS export ABC transporter protein LptC